MTPSARLAAAIELLEEIEAKPRRPADAVANDYFRGRRFIGSGDRRAVSEHAWTVLRTRRRLGWWLQRAGGAPTSRMLAATSMLLGGWDLGGLHNIFSGGQYAPANLIPPETSALRKLDGHTLEHPDMPVAVRLEIPDWLLPRFEARFGRALVPEMQAALDPAPLDLRVNLLKNAREEAQAALAAEGLDATPTPLSPWGLRIEGRRAVTAGPAFQNGLVEIQDEGSQVLAALVGAGPDMRVADYCAGAGGKTLALAMSMGNRGHIVACDVSAPRLDGAVRRLRRAGVHNAERHLLAAGDKWLKRRAGTFDRVLVDAPCTGTGTWRRNPDARLRLREQDLAELLPKQASILDAASRLVRLGGWLVFATCSLLPEENEMQVDAFLQRVPGFRLVPLAEAWTAPPPPCTGPYLSLTPLQHRTDGFFGAVLERVALIRIRAALNEDAYGIATVHVAAWRSAYAGILPDAYLTGLSVPRQAVHYQAAIDGGRPTLVAEADRDIVGFATSGRSRGELADGEIETLYVLDDWRDKGAGRGLMQASAQRLARFGCRNVFLWVLRDNPSRWFYQHLQGRPAAELQALVAGVRIPKTAYVWDPIDLLLPAPAKS